jgi:hypothetical protein
VEPLEKRVRAEIDGLGYLFHLCDDDGASLRLYFFITKRGAEEIWLTH